MQGKITFPDPQSGDVENETFPRFDIKSALLGLDPVLGQENKAGYESGAYISIVEEMVLANMRKVSGTNFNRI